MGAGEAFICAGVESMTRIPMGGFNPMPNPAMRDMFMGPRNIFRVKEALLSVLAGDVFGTTPIRGRLLVFKGLYYATSLLNFRRTVNRM